MPSRFIEQARANANPGSHILRLQRRIEAIEQFLLDEFGPADAVATEATEEGARATEDGPKKRGRPKKSDE